MTNFLIYLQFYTYLKKIKIIDQEKKIKKIFLFEKFSTNKIKCLYL